MSKKGEARSSDQGLVKLSAACLALLDLYMVAATDRVAALGGDAGAGPIMLE
jgi:hypothetical protein